MNKFDEFDEIFISTDKSKLNLNLIHNFLSIAYWSAGRTDAIIDKSIQNSLCFGVYKMDQQIGFARVITDYTIFAYLLDVFILEDYRGLGIGKKLIQTIINYPDLTTIKRWMLATTDAHNFYSSLGFKKLNQPEKFMEMVIQKN